MKVEKKINIRSVASASGCHKHIVLVLWAVGEITGGLRCIQVDSGASIWCRRTRSGGDFIEFFPCLAQTVAQIFASGTKEQLLLTTCPAAVPEPLLQASQCGVLYFIFLRFSVPSNSPPLGICLAWGPPYHRNQKWKSHIICKTFLTSLFTFLALCPCGRQISGRAKIQRNLKRFTGWKQRNMNNNQANCILHQSHSGKVV